MESFKAPRRIVLIGPSGSGKSELARRLGTTLGYDIIDTDSVIEQRVGMPVFEFFARFGEPAFRAIESQVLRDACVRHEVVIATGGGAVLDPANWVSMRPESRIIALSATAQTLATRIARQLEQSERSAVRPLLEGDPVAKLEAQLALRGPLYAQADLTIASDGLEPEQVERALLDFYSVDESGPSRLVPRFSLPTATERSDIYIDLGVSHEAARYARQRWPRARRIWLISDENVSAIWGDAVSELFQNDGYSVDRLVVPAGEGGKSFQYVESLCRSMTEAGVTRRDIVVALGGGVVGDLAGFVASICLRGLALIQIPTSLLSMVDSSVGGKTAINTGAGKNQVGAFYQPGLVLIDPRFLATLSPEEFRSGMAEVIKHSLIQPSTPLAGSGLHDLLQTLPSLIDIPADVLVDTLTLNVGIKHSVVIADERESGLRMILNFGHTAGQAIEADGYRYRHGEAVALGMMVAARIALHLERINGAWVERLERTLSAAELPTRLEGSTSAVLDLMSHDKKNLDGTLHWILPTSCGGVDVVTGIDRDMVRLALRDIGAT